MCQALFGLEGHRYICGRKRAFLAAVLVIVMVTAFNDGLEIFVNDVCRTEPTHPTAMFIKALIDKKLSPRRCTVGIEALRRSSSAAPSGETTCADSISSRAFLSRVFDGAMAMPFEPRGLFEDIVVYCKRTRSQFRIAIKCGEVAEADRLDITADAAL